MHRVVQRLLHSPTVRVRQLAAEPGGDQYAALLRELFDLDVPQRRPQAGRTCRSVGGAGRDDRMTLRLGTRGSALALAQSQTVADALTRGHRPSRSSWSRSSPPATARRAPVAAARRRRLRLRAARRAASPRRSTSRSTRTRTCPPRAADGLLIAAVPPREDPRDALVARDGLTLAELPRRRHDRHRRAAPHRPAARPGPAAVGHVPIRGNVDTRLRKARPTASSTRSCSPAAGLRPARPGRRDHRDARPDADAARARPGRARGGVPGRRPDLVELLAALDDAADPGRGHRGAGAARHAGGRVQRTGRRLAELAEGERRRRDLPARCGDQPGRRARRPAVRAPERSPTPAEIGPALAADLLDDGADTLYWEHSMTRTRKPVGRIAFVGAGPGDPGLLTRRAHDALTDADHVVYDRGVPDALLDVDHAPRPTAETRSSARPRARPATWPRCCCRRPGPACRAVHLVAGDPFEHDSVVKEVQAVARTAVPFEVVPGVGQAEGVATYAGVPLPGVRTTADVDDVQRARLRGAGRRGRARLARARGRRRRPRRRPRRPARRRRRRRARRSRSPATAPARPSTRPPPLWTASSPPRSASPAGWCSPSAPGVAHRDKLELVGEPPAVRLEGAGAADQGAGRRDERAAAGVRRDPVRGADDRGRAAAHAGADGAGDQGPGRRPVRLGRSSPRSTRCARSGRSSPSTASTPATSAA